MGIQMLVIIAGGVFGGYKLDVWMDNKFPFFLLFFSTLSLAASIYHSIKDFLKK